MNNLAEQGNTPAILALEQAMLASFDQEALKAQTDTQHYQIKGVYARTMFIPAGMLVTGKIHNFESIGILAQGTMRITNGETSVLVSAPYISVDKPGIKRLGYAETDCTFISVHRTDAEEITDIEDELVSDTFEEFETKRLGRPI
jgi:hypothetical protein